MAKREDLSKNPLDVEGEPDKHYRWIYTKHFATANEIIAGGYEPVKFEEIEQGKVKIGGMPLKTPEGFVGYGDLVLFKTSRESFEKRCEESIKRTQYHGRLAPSKVLEGSPVLEETEVQEEKVIIGEPKVSMVVPEIKGFTDKKKK